ncbi:MAG: class I SAM-dependent methyltransferase [Rhizobacter sp.]|nr:class I SAM-dependent methyltransferase [Bacteriovorax sp.]
MNCLLCQTDSSPFEADTFLCPNCALVFKNPEMFWNEEQDIARYTTHNNNSDDKGYVEFLRKIIPPLKPFIPKKFNALDFGCGPGPTLSLLLEEEGGSVENYDPIFFPDAHLLIPESYDVVTSTEVVEHFKNPSQDWELLTGLVKDNGILAIMTLLYSKEIDFKSWWYKNDATHVVFYQKETIDYLAEEYNLEVLYTDNKSIIIFKKRES